MDVNMRPVTGIIELRWEPALHRHLHRDDTTQNTSTPLTPSRTMAEQERGEEHEEVEEQSPLLRLPAELRDEIYRLATPLVYASNATWNRGIQLFTTDRPPPLEPGLLRVNLQVREEASAVYYKKNKFIFEIENLNATHYIKWCRVYPRRRLKANVGFTFKYERLLMNPEAYRTRNAGHGSQELHMPKDRHLWPNLVYWLERYYHRQCLGIPWSEKKGRVEGCHASHYTNTAAAVFETVGKLGKGCELTWEQVESILESTHRAIGSANSAWNGLVRYT